MKKINILIICMALLILATTAVSASEDKNLTLTDQGLEIDNESAKEDLANNLKLLFHYKYSNFHNQYLY